MPLFSIVVPVYNVEKFLEQCVDSFIDQIFTDWEMILVDDGSPDSSGEICDRYAQKDKRIKVIHQENMGLPGARNAGAKESTGEYLFFFDSDDYMKNSECLEIIAEQLNQQHQDMLVFPYELWYEKTNRVKKSNWITEKTDDKKCEVYSTSSMLALLFQNHCFEISAWSRVVKRKLLIQNKISFDENVRVGEDFEWTFQLYEAEPTVGYVSCAILVHRIREGSLTGERNPKGWESRYRLMKKWKPVLEEKSNQMLLSFLAYQYYLALGDIHNISDTKVRKEAYTQINQYKDIMKYGTGKRCLLCKIAVKCLGSHGAAWLLDTVIKAKRIA